MIRKITILLFLLSISFSQEYCAGDIISQAHQDKQFNICYPCDSCNTWSLSQYSGDILVLDLSASWCSPCYSSIDFMDELEAYWSNQNQNVKFITALADIGSPYSCNQWGQAGNIGSPTIVEDDGTLFQWFNDSNGQYPSYVVIDHNMNVRSKPSSMLSNSNTNACDIIPSDMIDVDCVNDFIAQLLKECGDGCSSGSCSDDSACNTGDNADCIYPSENRNCCGECTADIDCLGVCGGDATEAECEQECGICSNCINVPGDHITIQAGIDAATDGDTVLVEQGTYYENLIIQKSITLASRAILECPDQLASWYEYTGENYYVANENIVSTVLDGSQATNGDTLQSVILIKSPGDDCITPEIFGFTITGGEGTVVLIEEVNAEGEIDMVAQRRGAGFFAVDALPAFHYNYIYNNGGADTEAGGGGDETTGIDVPTHPDDDWGTPRSVPMCNGTLDLSYNFYRDNDALYGNTLAATSGFGGNIDMSNSIFDVYNCPENNVTSVWVDVESDIEVDFTNGIGDECTITDDVWVSPSGNDNNVGTTELEAFSTIGRALEMIAPDNDNPVTIILTDGTFSPSTTGEPYPIVMISNINLIGQGAEATILNAEGSEESKRRVIEMQYCHNNAIIGLTITGGYYPTGDANNDGGINVADLSGGFVGGGIRLEYSNPILANVAIVSNSAPLGGGIYLFHSDPILQNVTISSNTATCFESGNICFGIEMLLQNSSPIINNCIIWPAATNPIVFFDDGYSEPLFTYSDFKNDYNWIGIGNINADPLFVDPDNGNFSLQGDSPCIDSGDPSLLYADVDTSFNDMGVTGGSFIRPNFTSYDFGEIGDIENRVYFTLSNYRQTSITIDSVSFTSSIFSTPTTFPLTINPFEIGEIQINCLPEHSGDIEDSMTLVSDDLPEGVSISFSVTGTTGNLLSGNLIGTYFGIYQIVGDINVAFGDTVRLLPGTTFLFNEGNNFIVEGTLVAEGTEQDSIIFDNFSDAKWAGFTIEGVNEETIFNYVRISGANKLGGGGLFLFHSNPTLKNVTITENSAVSGGGMKFIFSNPALTNVTISENKGGGMFFEYSDPTLTNMSITRNTGGGMQLISSDPVLNNVILDSNINSSYGGGISLYSSDPTLNHVKITGNLAYYGGGMYLSNNSNPTLTNVTIIGNAVNGRGGGMYLSNNSNPTLTNVTITGNTAEEDGGGMVNYGHPILTNTILWDNSPRSFFYYSPLISYSNIEGDTILAGIGNINSDPTFVNRDQGDYRLLLGSPCIDSGTADIDEDGVEDITDYVGLSPDMGALEHICASNTYDDCGLCEGDMSVCTGCTDSEALNYSQYNMFNDGSCVYLIDQDLWVSITGDDLNNSGLSADNAFKTLTYALYRISQSEDNPHTIHITEGIFSPISTGEEFPINMKSHVNISGLGTSLSILDAEQTHSVMTMSNCENNNISGMTITGGGIPFIDLTPSNHEEAGGIDIYNSDPYLSNMKISNNTAEYGGGISLFHSDPILQNVIISGNTAGTAGGIYINHFSEPKLTNVTITDNTSNCSSGLLISNQSSPILTNVTISGNTNNEVDYQCGNISFFSQTPSILINTIIWDNGSNSIEIGSAIPIISYSNIQGDTLWSGEGNINTDPLFSDPENDDYTLLLGSPCIDTGTADIDEDGVEYITDYLGSAPDMGAYESDYGPLAIEAIALPIEYRFDSAYPNPFNPVTTLRFSLPVKAEVSLTIYNLQGRQVLSLIDGYMRAGYHSVIWNADSHSSGIYFVKMIADDYISTQKLMLVK